MKWIQGLLLILWPLLGWAEPQPVYHVVLLTLKPNVTQQQSEQVMSDTLNMLKNIPGVLEVAVGNKARDDRPQHIKNYHLAILVTLQSEAALDVYGLHPEHRQFIAKHKDKFESFQVADFERWGQVMTGVDAALE